MNKMVLALVVLFMATNLNVVNAQTKEKSKIGVTCTKDTLWKTKTQVKTVTSKIIAPRNFSKDVVVNEFLNRNLSYNQINLEVVTDSTTQEVKKIPSEKRLPQNRNIWENIGTITTTIIMFGWLIVEVALRNH